MSAPSPCALWLCADLASASLDVVAAQAARVADVFAVHLWVRPAAATPASASVALVRALLERVHARGGRVVVGDRVDVAIAAGADGVHLGAQSVAPEDARRLWRAVAGDAPLYLSAAVHDASAIDAAATHVDALVLSPLYAVPGKGAGLGVGRFAALRARAPGRAVAALGGIVSPADARDAARAGADAIALRRAWLTAADPVATCGALLEAFETARAASPTRGA